jgi:hypothetical protein
MEVGFGYDPHFTAAIVNLRNQAISLKTPAGGI